MDIQKKTLETLLQLQRYTKNTEYPNRDLQLSYIDTLVDLLNAHNNNNSSVLSRDEEEESIVLYEQI